MTFVPIAITVHAAGYIVDSVRDVPMSPKLHKTLSEAIGHGLSLALIVPPERATIRLAMGPIVFVTADVYQLLPGDLLEQRLTQEIAHQVSEYLTK